MKPVHATVAEKPRGAYSHQSGNEAYSHQSGNEAYSHHLGSKACSHQMRNEACSHQRGREARSGHNTEQRYEASFTLQKQRKFTLQKKRKFTLQKQRMFTLQKQRSDRWRCPPRFLSRHLASNTHVTPSPPNEGMKGYHLLTTLVGPFS